MVSFATSKKRNLMARRNIPSLRSRKSRWGHGPIPTTWCIRCETFVSSSRRGNGSKCRFSSADVKSPSPSWVGRCYAAWLTKFRTSQRSTSSHGWKGGIWPCCSRPSNRELNNQNDRRNQCLKSKLIEPQPKDSESRAAERSKGTKASRATYFQAKERNERDICGRGLWSRPPKQRIFAD